MEFQRVQFAFKDSMIHFILQFTLLFATGYVLHRYTNQEIRRQQFFSFSTIVPFVLYQIV